MTVIMSEAMQGEAATMPSKALRSFDLLLWGVAVFDGERRLQYYNPEFTRFLCAQTGLELTEDDLLGHTLPLESLWDGEPEPPKSRWQCLAPNSKFTIAAERLDPECALCRQHPELAYMLQLHPISATQEIPGELASAITLGQSGNKEKLELLTSFSHEFRTPLNAVLGFSSLLLDDLKDNQQQQYVESIISAGSHLLKLVNEILILSKADYECSEIALRTENVDVQQVISECVALLQPLARQSSVSLEQSGDPCYLICDGTRLKQIVLNLLSNAIKYNKRDGKVVIKCLAIGNRCAGLEVQDTGHGIPAELSETIFNPFKRLLMHSGNREGSGIGLMLTRRLVNMMGGRIRVSSRAGYGSVFAVDFNLDEELAGTAGVRSRNVLWLGRDGEARRFASSLVSQRNGLHMRCAEQIPLTGAGDPAISADLIIVDGDLGASLDGSEKPALQALLGKSAGLAISDGRDSGAHAKLDELGVKSYLTPDFDPVEFLAELDRV